MIRSLRRCDFSIRLSALSIVLAWGSSDAAPGKIDFNRDIRPILSDNCFSCHGPDKAHRKAKMRLDVREEALRKEAFVPGNPEDSELVTRIFTADEEEMMPPPDSNKKLTTGQRDLLKRWIAEGGEYQDHWAYIAPKRPVVPQGGGAVDAFVSTGLEQREITLSPEADKRTLLRRVSLDLTGLPPTPEEVRAFLADPDPKAYEHTVDRLLESPRYGERMAVPWLDVVRYADTVGFHGDQNVNVFPYRDYVVNAFNANKPFDQFTIDQLAGDLLPDPTPEQRVATAFNRLNMVTREGGAQPGEYLTKYAADRVRTVSGAWLGSTMGCAECHDHKFDPITARDFYSMAAFFADVKQWGVYNDYTYTPNPDLKGFSNEHPFPPEMEVPSAYLQAREAKLRQQADKLGADLTLNSEQQADFALWRKDAVAFLAESPTGWRTPSAVAEILPAAKPKPPSPKPPKPPKPPEPPKPPAPPEPPKPSTPMPATPRPDAPASVFTVESDGRVIFEGKASADTQLRLQPSSGWLAAIRLELFPDAKHGGKLLRVDGKSANLKPEFRLQRGKVVKPLAIRFADADRKEPRYSNGFEALGVHEAWRVANSGEPNSAIYLLDQPLRLEAGDEIVMTLMSNPLGCVRVSISPFASKQATPLASALAKDDAVAQAAWLAGTGANQVAFAKFKTISREIAECRGGRAKVVVTESMTPLTVRLLPRGNWQDESGEVVAPAPPHFLPPFLKPADGQRLTRLDLAKWLVAPENPLTARVFMNRLWKQFFGNALSAQTDDVGAQGEWPSHPELLDWLAVEFRESGWDVKRMVKLLVTSATYRQGSSLRLELRDIDPQNRLLASQNPRRLEAEFVRDNALAAAGLLNFDMGGPPIHPYQPPDYYAQLQFPDRDYHAEFDDRQYRRGLYSHWQRTFLHPMLANFDAPSREECAAFRTVANTPQQALTLLNDPTFVEAARVFASRLLAASPTDEQRLDLAFQLTLARAPKPAERQSLTAFLGSQREYFSQHADEAKKALTSGAALVPANTDPAQLAAWTQVCRVVLNLHETITRY